MVFGLLGTGSASVEPPLSGADRDGTSPSPRRLRGMDPIAPALLVLLACNPDAQSCREIRASETYATIETCRAALPETLRRMNGQGSRIIGRCASAEAGSGVDRVVTGSVESEAAIVRVTRGDGGRFGTETYRVPKAGR